MIRRSKSEGRMQGYMIDDTEAVVSLSSSQVQVDTSLLALMEHEGARSNRSARNAVGNDSKTVSRLVKRRDSGVSSLHSSTKSNTTNQFWMNCLDSDTNSLPTPMDSKNSNHSGVMGRRYSFSSARFGTEQQQEDECKENKRGYPTTVNTTSSCLEPSTAHAPPAQVVKAGEGSLLVTSMQNIETKPSHDNSTLAGTELLELHEAGESASPTTASTTSTSTASDNNDPYQWAYEVWKRHGLMQHTKGNSRRPVATKITYLQDQIWNEKLTGPKKPEKTEDQRQSAATRKSFSIQRTSYVNRGSFDDCDDDDSDQKRKVASARMSLPASVHASSSTINNNKKIGGKKNFANVLKKWREQSDDKPNTHFLSPEQLHYPSYVATKPTVWEPKQQRQDKDAAEPEVETFSKVPDQTWETPTASKPVNSMSNGLAETDATEQDETCDASNGRSITSTRRTNLLLQKKRAAALEEELKEPKPTSPQSQASRIKARYMETRHPSRSRSLSRGPRSRTIPKDPSPTGHQEEQQPRQSSKSPPPRSRGDFKTAVQDVLRRVDVISDMVEPRPVSAPRSGRKEEEATPFSRSKSAPRSSRGSIRPKSAADDARSLDKISVKLETTPMEQKPEEKVPLSVRVSSIPQEKERSSTPLSVRLSIHRASSKGSLKDNESKTNTIDPPGTVKKVNYRIQRQAPRPESPPPSLARQSRFDDSSSLQASYTPRKSKFDLELRRAVSAPRPRRTSDWDDKPKPEHTERLVQLRARRIARQAEKNKRSKSTPRPERSPAISSSDKFLTPGSTLAYDGSAPDVRDEISPPYQKTPVRVRDLLKLNTGSSYHRRGRSSISLASIPSHVEVKKGMSEADDDEVSDEGASLAESKLTDARTESESSSGVPLQGESPWTAQMLSKLEEYQGENGATPRGEMNVDRPWRRDRLKKRMTAMSDKPTMALGEEAKDACNCFRTVFSDRDELIEFFLPLLGTGCKCGKRSHGLVNPDEPTAIENILRPWQVEFLAAFGIYRGDQMVKAHHRSAGALATALRQYRKRKKMTSFRTKSCVMALEIWSKTCRAFVRSIRKQLESGTAELKLPNTLYILSSFLEKLPSDDALADHTPSVVTSSTVKRPRARTPTSGSIRERAQQFRESRRYERSESPHLASQTF